MNRANRDELTVKLETALAELHKKVLELNEAATGKQASVVLRDIYAHAIPNLVYMLQSARQWRTRDYGKLDDTDVLKQMTSIQDIILLLCQKAASWKAKSKHEIPIVRPTRQKIRPNLHTIRKAFQAKLEQRERSFVQKQRAQMLAEAHEKRFEEMMKENEENGRKRKEKAMKIKEDLDRTKRLLGLQRRERMTSRQVWSGGEHQDVYPNHQELTDRWTDEQNLELIVQLQNPESRHLPGVHNFLHTSHIESRLTSHSADQRYLVIINAPLLQDKLPEQIRERAIHFKSAMQQCWGTTDYVESIK